MDKFKKINNFDLQLLKGVPGLTIYDDQLFLNDSTDYPWSEVLKSFRTCRPK